MYYHGSYVLFEDNHELVVNKKGYATENSMSDVESLIETLKPLNKISRKDAVFIVDDIDLIDPCGGYTDIIYKVDSVYVEKSDLAWLSECLKEIESGRVDNAIICAKNYWNGELFDNLDESCVEYRCLSAIIKEVVELNVELEELSKPELIKENLKEAKKPLVKEKTRFKLT